MKLKSDFNFFLSLSLVATPTVIIHISGLEYHILVRGQHAAKGGWHTHTHTYKQGMKAAEREMVSNPHYACHRIVET